jgi:hypothetical protein
MAMGNKANLSRLLRQLRQSLRRCFGTFPKVDLVSSIGDSQSLLEYGVSRGT